MKKIVGYAFIIILLFMLFLPPMLRHFTKDLKTIEVSKSKDEVRVLNCTRLNEKINTSYLNGKAYNLQYQIKGDYVNSEEELNNFQKSLLSKAKITYDNLNNSTDYRVDFNALKVVPSELTNYAKQVNEQKIFYTNLGYNCSENNF